MNGPSKSPVLPKPPWLKVRLGGGANYARINGILKTGRLHTVCEEALCPNQGHCWDHGRATIMILGAQCTRNCTFCNVTTHRPGPVDTGEPARVVEAVQGMKLEEVVITSVTRDDLDDGGAVTWAETIEALHREIPGLMVEVLVPDFQGRRSPLDRVLRSKPDVFGHNIETVPRLYATVRPQAVYARSLDVLRHAHDAGRIAKTGIMLGLGETAEEVASVMRDAVAAGVEIFSIGQYLQPSRAHTPVIRYVEPAEFEAFRIQGRSFGFKVVLSAPLVRSSFHATEQSEFVRRRLAGCAAPVNRGPSHGT
jgi:lipoic acid synthetase